MSSKKFFFGFAMLGLVMVSFAQKVDSLFQKGTISISTKNLPIINGNGSPNTIVQFGRLSKKMQVLDTDRSELSAKSAMLKLQLADYQKRYPIIPNSIWEADGEEELMAKFNKALEEEYFDLARAIMALLFKKYPKSPVTRRQYNFMIENKDNAYKKIIDNR